MAERSPSPLPCPVYLGGALARRWEELAPELQKLGTLDALNVDLCGKYILAENEYLRVSALVQEAIAKGDGDDATKWIGVQDKLTKQILQLGGELGITPRARRARGLGGGDSLSRCAAAPSEREPIRNLYNEAPSAAMMRGGRFA